MPNSSKTITEQEAVGFEKWQKLLTVIATILALLGLCAVTVRLGMAIHHTLLLFALGGLVAYALDPPVEWLAGRQIGSGKKHLGRKLSVSIVFLGMILLVVGGVWWLGGQAAHQSKVLEKDFPRYKERAISLAHDFDENVLRPRNIAFSLADSIQKPPPEADALAEKVSREALPILAHTATSIAEIGIVLLIALYFLIYGNDMKIKANRLLSPTLLPYALSWEEDVNRILGGFVRGQAILALVTGIAASIGLLLVGVHLWLLIGLFVVVASLIPVIGPYIAAVPAVIAALVEPTHLTPLAGGVVVLLLFIIINEVVSKVLYPKLVGKALNLHEVVVFFVLFAGLEIDGIIGTLFAAPLTALTMITIFHLYRLWQRVPEGVISETEESENLPDSLQ